MRIIIIGAGHNGLTAAFYLAKAGMKPLVLEKTDTVGGGAITTELHPGFRCPTLAHHVALRSDIAADMGVASHGVEFVTPLVDASAFAADAPATVLYHDVKRTSEALRTVSAKDGAAYPAYRAAIVELCRVLSSLSTSPAPPIDEPDLHDIWNLIRTARRFRALDRKHAYALLRWAPMPVADLAAEWFESDLLRAVVAAPGLSGTMFGPRSAGSALVLLLHETTRMLAGGASRVRGGPGALTHAMAAAARTAGAEIETATPVERIVVDKGRVTGIVAGGREIAADGVVSAIDPKTTFLDLVEPAHLTPDFLMKVRNYRANGTLAKVNLALSALPSFTGFGPPAAGAGPDAREALSGRIHIGPGLDYLERAFDHAKYGELSAEPWLDVTIPSILDPDLAPSGGHVMSIYAHYAPYNLRNDGWPAMHEPLVSRVLSALERVAPGISSLVVAADVITPLDLERRFGFYGGHIFHGELALDQLVSMRPVLGFARYDSPIRGLYLCSAGTHPGGFMSGASGRMAARTVLSTVG